MTKLPTIDIKGKEYVMVKDRIVAFNELYPKGEIRSEIISNDEKSVVVKAFVIPETGRLFTGHSEAYRGDGMMGDVPVEVAETSAVGRALAMLGIGIIESVASADEVVKATKPKAMATDKQVAFIEKLVIQKDQAKIDTSHMGVYEAKLTIDRLMKLPNVNDGDDRNDNIEGEKAIDYNPATGELLP